MHIFPFRQEQIANQFNPRIVSPNAVTTDPMCTQELNNKQTLKITVSQSLEPHLGVWRWQSVASTWSLEAFNVPYKPLDCGLLGEALFVMFMAVTSAVVVVLPSCLWLPQWVFHSFRGSWRVSKEMTSGVLSLFCYTVILSHSMLQINQKTLSVSWSEKIYLFFQGTKERKCFTVLLYLHSTYKENWQVKANTLVSACACSYTRAHTRTLTRLFLVHSHKTVMWLTVKEEGYCLCFGYSGGEILTLFFCFEGK